MASSIANVIDFLAVARDSYTSKYDAHKKVYEEEVKTIKQDFKLNTPRYNEEMSNAKKKFEANVQQTREEIKPFVTEQINDLREDELFKVRQINTVAMEKLSVISHLPLSAAELSVLQNCYAPNDEYWATKMIADLAEKNGLKPTQFLRTASLDTKLNVLQQLEEQLDKLMADYDGTVRYSTLVLLHDATLMRAERTYNNGFAFSDMEDSQIARRLFLQLKGKSIAEQSIGLQNIMNNATPEIKRALFYEMENNTGIIEDDALRWAGLADEFESYQKNEHKAYTEAKKGIEKVLSATSKEEIEQIAKEWDENTYFKKMLSNVRESNINVAKYFTKSDTAVITQVE